MTGVNIIPGAPDIQSAYRSELGGLRDDCGSGSNLYTPQPGTRNGNCCLQRRICNNFFGNIILQFFSEISVLLFVVNKSNSKKLDFILNQKKFILKKSHIWETLNVPMCADSSTNTKKIKTKE